MQASWQSKRHRAGGVRGVFIGGLHRNHGWQIRKAAMGWPKHDGERLRRLRQCQVLRDQDSCCGVFER